MCFATDSEVNENTINNSEKAYHSPSDGYEEEGATVKKVKSSSTFRQLNQLIESFI